MLLGIGKLMRLPASQQSVRTGDPVGIAVRPMQHVAQGDKRSTGVGQEALRMVGISDLQGLASLKRRRGANEMEERAVLLAKVVVRYFKIPSGGVNLFQRSVKRATIFSG